jgi:hypothetical protein
MRHLCSFAPIEISLLSRGAVGPPSRGTPIASSGGSIRCSPGSGGTRLLAIPVTVVTAAAQVECQPAATADDEAQGVHGSGRDRQKLGRVPEPCDEGFVEGPARGLRPKARVWDSGLHSFGSRCTCRIASQARGRILGGGAPRPHVRGSEQHPGAPDRVHATGPSRRGVRCSHLSQGWRSPDPSHVDLRWTRPDGAP